LQAESLYSELLQSHPDHYEALLHRALIRLRLKQSESALQDAQNCTSLRPESALSFMVEGECLLELGRFEEARQSFMKALAFEKDNGRIHFGLGVSCASLGLHLEAGDAFEQALHFEKDYCLAQWMARLWKRF
jgi:Flp pilus assembly protein TadD